MNAMTDDIGDLDGSEYEDVRMRFDRGDYVTDSSEWRAVKKWLREQEREREFIRRCERASISAALDARRAARWSLVIAILSLVISAISASDDVGASLRSLVSALRP